MVRGPDRRPGTLRIALVATCAAIAAFAGACATREPSSEPSSSGPVTVAPNGGLLLRPADAELAGVVKAGGLTDLWVRGPDGPGAYLIFLRTLMPDESVP